MGSEPAVAASPIRVAVACSPVAGQGIEAEVELPAGATAADAIRASGLVERHPGLDTGAIGVWGRPCGPGAILRDGDRVEIYRPLTMDPTEARRLRAKKLRAAGS